MASTLLVFNLGERGVNVDRSPLHLEDNQLTKSQNAISDPLGTENGLKNRPGLTKFNFTAANGSILGGISVPLLDLTSSTTTERQLFISRGSAV